MLAINLLSESAGPDLGWLLWLVLALFAVVVIVGWMASNKKGDEVVLEKKAEIAVPAMPATPATPDDLKKLEGIGPKVERVLNGAGVKTFAELAGADAEKLREVLVAAKLQMLEPSGWMEQAVFAAKGDWDGLEKLQSELKGGRRRV